jgi:hypothetical protein
MVWSLSLFLAGVASTVEQEITGDAFRPSLPPRPRGTRTYSSGDRGLAKTLTNKEIKNRR